MSRQSKPVHIAVIAALADALHQQGLVIVTRQADAEDAQEIVKLNAHYGRQTTQTVLKSAQRIAEIGNDMRIGFAHLLTEQLASGDEELLDAFQSFVAVLPARSPAAIVPAYPAVHKAATNGLDHVSHVSGEESATLSATFRQHDRRAPTRLGSQESSRAPS